MKKGESKKKNAKMQKKKRKSEKKEECIMVIHSAFACGETVISPHL
jgi:hypothetical protein